MNAISDRLRNQIATLFSLNRPPLSVPVERPRVMEGWCSIEKAETLARYIIEYRCSLVVESGVFGGKSLIAMALACKELGSGVVYGIDPWTLDAALEGDIGEENAKWWTQNVDLEKIYEGFVGEVITLGLLRQCRWIRAKGEMAARLFTDGTIDLLNQDDNHSELVSCRNVKVWGRKLAKGGLWVWDDTDWPTQAKALAMVEGMGYECLMDSGKWKVYRKPI